VCIIERERDNRKRNPKSLEQPPAGLNWGLL
jgi:hypothetical protein